MQINYWRKSISSPRLSDHRRAQGVLSGMVLPVHRSSPRSVPLAPSGMDQPARLQSHPVLLAPSGMVLPVPRSSPRSVPLAPSGMVPPVPRSSPSSVPLAPSGMDQPARLQSRPVLLAPSGMVFPVPRLSPRSVQLAPSGMARAVSLPIDQIQGAIQESRLLPACCGLF